MNDLRKVVYGTLIGFIVVIVMWVGFLFIIGCGGSVDCTKAIPTPEHTAIPTLVPATLPVSQLVSSKGAATPATTEAVAGASQEIARPSNAGGAGLAVMLAGDVNSGEQIYTADCAVCHGPQGKGGVVNAGSTDGTVPPLNPIDETLKAPDYTTFAYNVDLFIEHGSTPEGTSPTLQMPAWGDLGKLQPQQIADVMAYLIKLNGGPARPASAATPPPAGVEIARPSNPGGAGLAITLAGNVDSGKGIFAANCVACHAAEGKGGVPNPGSTDGTVPPLNPIDETIKSADPLLFAYNIDLFIEHGSTPEGTSPTLQMPAWGGLGKLRPQQIADVIAYLMSLNK
jgi:mono/diheme cytochrome c family protein